MDQNGDQQSEEHYNKEVNNIESEELADRIGETGYSPRNDDDDKRESKRMLYSNSRRGKGRHLRSKGFDDEDQKRDNQHIPLLPR